MVANLPHGTITLLLTDLEHSTKWWEEYPEAMSAALAQHDALVADRVAAHGGVLIKARGEGDSAFSVFPRATDALAAACDLQLRLLHEVWPEPLRLRVRMALHTGECEQRDGDYFGPPVNRCARLRSVAYGGQTLLSGVTAALVQESLPPGVSLLSLGTHRLKDLSAPEPVFALMHPDLSGDFPPLKSISALPNNLPTPMTRFIGRERELVELRDLLDHTRLLSLIGAGGAGKSRLSVQLGAEMMDAFPDGVWFVELAPLADPALLPLTVAQAVGLQPAATQPVVQVLTDYLKGRTVLLILDNCEHMVAAAAALADALLRACPHLRILATSREPLGVHGERGWRIPTLSLPNPTRLPTLEALTTYEAVRLFIDRAVLAQPAFQVTNQNAPAVAQIVHRLDGIPLALELAAARVKMLSVEQIAARLDDRFRLLTGGSRTALPRQQTLRALVDWSYELLSPAERALWRRLAICAGGFTLEAAEAVCAFAAPDGEAIEPYAVLDLLGQLVDKSVVLVEERDEAVRYRLLETIRQYGRDRLHEAGEVRAVRDRHQDWYVALAAEAQENLYGPGRLRWQERLDPERENFRGAMEWCLETDARAGVRLARGLLPHWELRDLARASRPWLEALVQRLTPGTVERAWALHGLARLVRSCGEVGTSREMAAEAATLARHLDDPQLLIRVLTHLAEVTERPAEAEELGREALAQAIAQEDWLGQAQALTQLGRTVVTDGRLDEARSLLEQALALGERHGDLVTMAAARGQLGTVARTVGDLGLAREHWQAALGLSRELNDKAAMARHLRSLANVAAQEGDLTAALDMCEAALVPLQETGARGVIAHTQLSLGNLARMTGDLARARAMFAEALATCRELQNKVLVRWLLICLGYVLARQGEHDAARAALRECVDLARELGGLEALASSLLFAGLAAGMRGEHGLAVRWIGAALAAYPAQQNVLDTDERADLDRCLLAAEGHWGADAYAAARAAAAVVPLEQAVAEVIA